MLRARMAAGFAGFLGIQGLGVRVCLHQKGTLDTTAYARGGNSCSIFKHSIVNTTPHYLSVTC